MEKSSALPQPQPTPKKATLGRYWKRILSNITEAVTVYDRAGQVIFANDLASKNLRYSSVSHLMSQTVEDIATRYTLHDEEGSPMSVSDLPSRRALREVAVVQCTVHFVRADGDEDFWLIAKSFPIIGRDGSARFVVSAFQDITLFKTTEVRLRDANRRMTDILEDLLRLEA